MYNGAPEMIADYSIKVASAKPEEIRLAASLREAMGVEMDDSWDSAYPGWRQRFTEYFLSKQESGTGDLFLAWSNDEAIGMLAVSLVDDYHLHTRGRVSGRINAVYVNPAHRRKGVANQLMSAAIDWFKSKHCQVVRLNSSEMAVPLYASFGFSSRREMELSLR